MVACRFSFGNLQLNQLLFAEVNSDLSKQNSGSQPLSGLTGNKRCEEDEFLIEQIAEMSPSRKLIIFDARPKTNAVANQMNGIHNFFDLYQYQEVEQKTQSITKTHYYTLEILPTYMRCTMLGGNFMHSSISPK
jgi:hypothetical protein